MSHDDTTLAGNEISPTDVVHAVERRAFGWAYRVLIYPIGALAVGGAGIGAAAHSRIANEHDQTLINTQAIQTIQEGMSKNREDQKEESRRVNEKLDELMRLLLDRETQGPSLGRGNK